MWAVILSVFFIIILKKFPQKFTPAVLPQMYFFIERQVPLCYNRKCIIKRKIGCGFLIDAL